MRHLILDTETTGLEAKLGHRIIEIAAVEVVDRRLTGRSLHYYVNPERDIDLGATDVHGLTWETLRDKPRFADIAAELIEFARGAAWVIHNAPFDLAFLDAELERVGLSSTASLCESVIDTLALAREQFPGKKNSLDALCERFGVDNAHRTLHGALLDARLLAEVYLAMTRGQESLVIDLAPPESAATLAGEGALPPVRVLQPSAEEWAAHRDYLAAIASEARAGCVWFALEEAGALMPCA
ncbi:MAG TPA: DNA polymerase III subunit epsilon [Casimicrobiaceae bacterium]|jgi:DNA polymerase-3 subunit epsilon|nr:DNA polymerase III subunit epsilon [Casimicrobiaceae bacterium]